MAERRAGKAAAGVFAIVGIDSLLAERALGEILLQELGSEAATATQVVRGEEATWTKLMDQARLGALFAPRRALVVRNAEALKGGDEPLAAYLDAPNPDVVLVLLAAKPDKRRTAWKRLLERARTVSVEPLKGRALRAFVVEELRRKGLKLGEDAIDELIERVGQDLRRLVGELDKLAAYAGEGQVLSADQVAQVLGRGLARPFYKLGDLLWERRSLPLLELVEELLQDGESGLLLLATLHRALRQLHLAQALQARRAPRDEILARTRVMPFKLNELLEAARRYSPTDLQRALRAFGDADRRLKTGMDAATTLLAAILTACGGQAVRAVRPSQRPTR